MNAPDTRYITGRGCFRSVLVYKFVIDQMDGDKVPE